METIFSEFINLTLTYLFPILAVVTMASFLMNFFLAVIQVQEQSVSFLVKAALVSAVCYFFGQKFFTELGKFILKIINHFPDV